MAEDIFILPKSTDEMGDTVPKYLSRTGVNGYSGTIHFFDKETYPDLPCNGQEMYVVRVYADSSSVLNDIASYDDAYSKQEYGYSDSEITSYLNDRFDKSLTYSEWMDRFKVS